MILFSCTSCPDDLDQPDPLLRSPEHTEACKAAFNTKILWETYRIIDNVMVSLLALAILKNIPYSFSSPSLIISRTQTFMS